MVAVGLFLCSVSCRVAPVGVGFARVRFSNIMDSTNKTFAPWSQEDKKLLNLIKLHPDLYSRKEVSPKIKSLIWKEIAEETGMTHEQCRKIWSIWKTTYKTIRQKQILDGKISNSKLADGSLSFLDSELNFISKPSITTVMTVKTIDTLLKLRNENDDIDIDSHTLEIIYKKLIDQIDTAILKNKVAESLVNVAEASNVAPIKIPIATSEKTLQTAKKPKLTQFQIEDNIELEYMNFINIAPGPVENKDIFDTNDATIESDLVVMESLINDVAMQALCNSDNRGEVIQNSSKIKQVFERPIDEHETDKQSECVDDLRKYGELETILDIHDARKDSRQFFKDMADYVIKKFTPEKLSEIRLKICSIVTEAELEDMK